MLGPNPMEVPSPRSRSCHRSWGVDHVIVGAAVTPAVVVGRVDQLGHLCHTKRGSIGCRKRTLVVSVIAHTAHRCAA